MLFAVAHRPMTRESKMIFVKKSFLSLNVLLVVKLVFGMKLLHAEVDSDSLFNPTLYSAGIFVSITSSGSVGHSQKVSTSSSSDS